MIALPPALQSGLLRQLLLLSGLLLAALAVAVLLGAILVITRHPPPAIPPAPSTLAEGSIELPAPTPSEDAGEMLVRPLFWNTRRPEPEAGPAEEPAPVLGPDILDNVRLLGVFAAGDSAGIIINVAGQRQRLMVGEQLQQWTLQGLSAAGANFVASDDASMERLLPLEHARVKPERRPPGQIQEPATADDSPE
ncbi:hypothetical protein Q6D67_12500 [Haliea sp. E1-2-M8]|uniref:hypothetical protein n=1 Tax=Haliea sp. E1-2-M8 TaxID=3064706 RepID=UPI002720F975|nr:hypothetical protein [Haliea sp. E1-2-M8]MDO8862523.1 hypothetical protein [Haliea sp. E1-2-M8]